jgi:hypothetical protein
VNCLEIIAYLAQVANSQVEVTLSNLLFIYGPMGAWIGWFMLRHEKHADRQWKETRAVKHSLNGLSKALLINALGDNSSPFSRSQAEQLLAEMNSREHSE